MRFKDKINQRQADSSVEIIPWFKPYRNVLLTDYRILASHRPKSTVLAKLWQGDDEQLSSSRNAQGQQGLNDPHSATNRVR